MPEWSKGEDLRSSVFALAGSNPAPVIFYFKHLTSFIKSLLLYFITRFSLSYRFPIYPSPPLDYTVLNINVNDQYDVNDQCDVNDQ